MTKAKTTKRALLASALSLLLCVSMLIGTTFAWFTDSVTSGRNKIIAGNLDVELEYKDADGNWVSIEDDPDLNLFEGIRWEPGMVVTQELKVKNVGSLALKYKLLVDVLGYNTVLGTERSLADVLTVGSVTAEEIENEGISEREDFAAKATEELGRYALATEDHLSANDGEEGGDDEAVFTLVLYWEPRANDNDYNLKNGLESSDGEPLWINLGVDLLATQYTEEKDSFDETYDASAEYPALAPRAIVYKSSVDYDTFEWSSWGSLEALDPEKDRMEAVYTFECVETAEEAYNSPYADWLCDFYVSLDRDLEEDQILLGGNYSGYGINFGWVGFYNGDYMPKANEETALLATFLGGISLPYKEVAGQIGTFKCGVGDVGDVLAGATFTVTLRITNPDDPTDTIDIAVVTYTFGRDELPTATVAVEDAEAIQNDPAFEWGTWGGLYPDNELDENPRMEAIYTFKCDEDAIAAYDSPYKDWLCDFYVKLDRALEKDQILLGGNYGSFGWIGFHNGSNTLEAGQEIGLLGTFLGGVSNLTYYDVASFVGEFMCGVGDVNDVLSGATFTVTLRIINPADTNESYDIAVVNYTFD